MRLNIELAKSFNHNERLEYDLTSFKGFFYAIEFFIASIKHVVCKYLHKLHLLWSGSTSSPDRTSVEEQWKAFAY